MSVRSVGEQSVAPVAQRGTCCSSAACELARSSAPTDGALVKSLSPWLHHTVCDVVLAQMTVDRCVDRMLIHKKTFLKVWK